MVFLDLAVQTIVISVTGVCSPGPLTAISASRGLVQGWKAGFFCALGHMIVEFPISFLIALGLFEALRNTAMRALIGISGGLVLIYLGLSQIKQKGKEIQKEDLFGVKTLFAGMIASGLNPYFIIWWLTIGAKLISESLLWMGWVGFLSVYVLHVWMDYVWLMFVAHIFRKGKDLSSKGFEILGVLLNAIIVLLGIKFVLDTLSLLHFS